MVMLVSALQFSNAATPIEVMEFEFGMVILVRPLQPENALSPMEVTDFPIVTLDNLVKPYTKKAGIFCTLSPMMMVEIFNLSKGSSSLVELKLAHETALKMRVSNKVQRWNA